MIKNEIIERVSETGYRKKVVALSKIKVIDIETVSIEGQVLYLTASSRKSLFRILKMDPATVANIGVHVDNKVARDLTTAMQKAMSRTTGSVLVVAEGINIHSIMGMEKAKNIVPFETYLEFLDQIKGYLGEHEIDSQVFDGRNVFVDLLSPKTVEIDGFEHEAFKSGSRISLDLFGGVTLSKYIHREVCSNGLILPKWHALQTLHMGSPLTQWSSAKADILNTVQSNSFYRDKMIEMQDKNASYRELEMITNWIESAYRMVPETGIVGQDVLRLDEIIHDYAKVGIDVTELSQNAKANAQTPVNLWDAYNALTSFATHERDNEFVSAGRCAQLQSSAGKLLTRKAHDMDNFVVNPYALN